METGVSMKRTLQLIFLAAAMLFASLAMAAKPRPRPAPVVMKYTLTIFNATGSWGDPNAAAKVGLGAQVFDGPTHMVRFTGYGHQSQIKNYSVIAKDGKRVDGQTLALTSASVEIFDANYNLVAQADFLPGEVYVGSDLTNYGIGFGSKIYPIYPYAMTSGNVTGPQYTLDRDFMLNDYSLSCVGYSAGNCLNTRDGSTKYLLKTTKGDLWIGTEGITYSSFNSARQY
jgi:hypothetical protein